MIEAINDAHRVMMARDPDIIVFGEDVGYFGGVFRATAGLQTEFGKTRCFDAHSASCQNLPRVAAAPHRTKIFRIWGKPANLKVNLLSAS